MALLNLTYFFLILPEYQSDENYCFAHHHSKGLPGAARARGEAAAKWVLTAMPL